MSTIHVMYDDVFHHFAIQAEAFDAKELFYIGHSVHYVSLDDQSNHIPERLREFLEQAVPDEERTRVVISAHEGYVAFHFLRPEHFPLFESIFEVSLIHDNF